jgi:hypothetical protein
MSMDDKKHCAGADGCACARAGECRVCGLEAKTALHTRTAAQCDVAMAAERAGGRCSNPADHHPFEPQGCCRD